MTRQHEIDELHSRLSHRDAWPSGDWGSPPLEGGIEAAVTVRLEASDDPERLLAERPARWGYRP